MEPQLVDILGRELTDIEKKNAPKQIFTVGSVPIKPRIAVIGSRQATPTAISYTKNLVKRLVPNNVIVSGLAKGIDYTAHTTAIDNKGHTIAIMGTPIDQCYPHEHIKLLNIIKQEHMVISQFPKDSKINRSNFVLRNFTISLISDLCILVQARYGSGTLYVANEMLRLNKPLYITDFVDDRIRKDLLDKGAIHLKDYMIDDL